MPRRLSHTKGVRNLAALADSRQSFAGSGTVVAIVASWVFTNNLIEKVNFAQDTNAPLAFSHNGYWALTASELQWPAREWLEYHADDWYGYPLVLTNASQLTPALNGCGSNEVVLTSALPYQTGQLRNY